MKKHSDDPHVTKRLEGLLGLGRQSVRKNYYPALLDRIAELEEERNRYKWLFENALHGIFQADLSAGLRAVNPALASICRYADAETMIEAVSSLRDHLFVEPAVFDELCRDVLSSGRIRARELRILCGDGAKVEVAMTMLRRQDLGHGVVEAFVADISVRKQSERRLEQMNQELEDRVEARTAELQAANDELRREVEHREQAEADLVEAMEEARAANDSKDKYLAAASHDLLQPLNAARLLVATLQERSLEASSQTLVDRIHHALEGAEDLLADLLDISKLDQKAMVPDLVWVDLQALVGSVVSEFEAVASQAGLALRYRTRPVWVRADQRMMTRVVRNLVSNAFRYTQKGGVLVSVRYRGDAIRLEVWDTGVGIPEDRQQEVFREFSQLKPPSSDIRRGVGLGLAIVDRMTRMLGFDIDVRSTPGRGSRFAIVMDRPSETIDMMVRNRADVVPTTPFSGCAVMVVDNDERVRLSMEGLLEQWGCGVKSVVGMQDALACCREFEPDVILSDLHLDDGLTGCEVIHRVRKSINRDIPAAIITADRSDACRRFLRAQYLPVLSKPVKPNRLRALLTSLGPG